MREKIVAMFFILVILGIPVITAGKNVLRPDQKVQETQNGETKEEIFFDNVMVQDELSGEESLSADRIAEINREEQLKMQEALQQTAVAESIEPESKEEEESSFGSFMASLKASVGDFTGNLAMIEEAAKLNSNLSSALADDAYIESAQVLAGKGGWLFYKRADDGTSMQDYQGTSSFSDATMETIANQMLAQRDYFAEKGARFVVMIVPNKEIIYSEFMPSMIYRSSEITRCDKLYDYLTANTDLEIVYPKLELFAAKNICPVFYKYDTHWNRIGAFVGVQSILQQLYGSCQDVAKVEIITENTNTSGDLAAMINMTDKYNNDSFYSVASDSYDPALQVPEDLLIIGDSFSTLMMDDLKYYFEDARQVGVWTFKKSMLDEYQPDVIIWECVERYADRFSWIDLIDD